MEGPRQDDLLEVVRQVYEAAIEPRLWPGLLARLASLTRSSLVWLVLSFPTGIDGGQMISTECDSRHFQAMTEHFWKVDPWRLRNLGGHLDWNVELGRAVLPHSELIKTEFYNDWMRPQEFLDSLAVNLVPGTVSSALACFRRAGEDYDDKDVAFVSALAPHLQQAVAVTRQLEEVARERDVLGVALDRFATGVIVLDAKARVLRVNRAAERILALQDGLSISQERLVAGRSDDTRVLRRLVGAAAETGNGQSVDSGGSMALRRPSGRRPLALLVSPIHSIGADVIDRRAAALVFVSDPEKRLEPPVEVLRQIWGLTTAEARVASLLSAGDRVEDVAELLRVRTNTVRVYLKRVFAKTGTSRQAQLVSLLARTLAGSRPGDEG